MTLEPTELQPDLLVRKVWAKIDPPLPEGCWWELYENNCLVKFARLEKGQISELEVEVTCAKSAELTLHIYVPGFIGKQCLLKAYDGGLVIIDTLELAEGNVKTPARVRPNLKPKREAC